MPRQCGSCPVNMVKQCSLDFGTGGAPPCAVELGTTPNRPSTPCSTCGGSGMSVVWNFCPECGRRL